MTLTLNSKFKHIFNVAFINSISKGYISKVYISIVLMSEILGWYEMFDSENLFCSSPKSENYNHKSVQALV